MKENNEPRKKNTSKLRGRNNLDYIFPETKDPRNYIKEMLQNEKFNPSLIRQEELKRFRTLNPVDPAMANWIEVGPLAITNGQTYGGADVIVTGRVTEICPHPSDRDIIYLASSRGGIWKSIDRGVSWTPMSDHEDSLAIGAMVVSPSSPQTIYAGTGEGNLQFYSTNYTLDSAPGIYLGVGVLKSTDGGLTWTLQGNTQFANESFYSISIDITDADNVFAATSDGLYRTTNGGTNWNQVTGGGLPTLSTSIIACTDVIVCPSDTTGNTVFAAYWGDGIYKSTNALGTSPTWTKLTSGLPSVSTIGRISLAYAPSSPSKKYALYADNTALGNFMNISETTNAAGTNWSSIITSGITMYGSFTSKITVDPTTPNTIYSSGVELYKSTFDGTNWSTSNIGSNIHPDSHAFGFDPTDNQIIYSGNDGGIFKSSDGGTNWDDSINIGLNLLQYEAIDDYPTSDAIVIGGTQDNGTNSYRNCAAFYHSDDGDGGYCAINELNGDQQISSYFGNNFKRSTNGGDFTTWSGISSGLGGSGLFYPPLAKSPTSARVVVGTNRLNINNSPYTASSWTQVTLPSFSGRVSAVSFANDTTIYAATTSGQVYSCTLSGTTWTATNITASPLPTGWIWDIQADPANINRVLLVFANFGLSSHAWIGTVSSGSATWTAASGTGSTSLPDVPFYSIAFETSNTIYLGSDIGVFRTIDGGNNWTNFSQGLPNTAVYDLKYYAPDNLLRAGTHGRGLWEIQTNLVPTPSVDLYFRDHAMHTGRNPSGGSVQAGFDDSLQFVSINDNLHWWQSVDIKVDTPDSSSGGYQFPISDVDFIVYQTQLQHENPEKGNVNRVYVRIQNRGINDATNITVKIQYAGASAGLPDLPSDYWTQFPNNSTLSSPWNSIGASQTIPTLKPTEEVILQWDWNPPASADTHSCMLVVMDSPSDPIPAANKVFNISQLIRNEKRAALKNLHLVNTLPTIFSPIPFRFNIVDGQNSLFTRIEFERKSKYFDFGIVFPHEVSDQILKSRDFKGFKIKELSEKDIHIVREKWIENEYKNSKKVDRFIENLDFRFCLVPTEREAIIKTELPFKEGSVDTLLLCYNHKKTYSYSKFSIIQENEEGLIEGGSTFILRNPSKFKD